MQFEGPRNQKQERGRTPDSPQSLIHETKQIAIFERFALTLSSAVRRGQWKTLRQALHQISQNDEIDFETKKALANLEVKDERGITAPLIFGFFRGQTHRLSSRVVSNLLRIGLSPSTLDHDKKSQVEVALETGALLSAHVLLQAGAPTPELYLNKRYTLPSLNTHPPVVGDLRALIQEIVRLSEPGGARLQSNVSRIVETSDNPYVAYVYLLAFSDVTRTDGRWTGKPLASFFPHAMHSLEFSDIQSLFVAIENRMDSFKNAPGKHPNDAELAGLLGHPRVNYQNRFHLKTINALTRAFTSITRFIDEDLVTIPREHVETYAALGRHAHSFAMHRFDTQRVYEGYGTKQKRVKLPSLFEQIGLRRCPARPNDKYPDGNKDWFGSGYFSVPHELDSFSYLTFDSDSESLVRKRFDIDVYLEPRRLYKLISNPNYGTLLIRNSSTEFGRDILPHFAYWSAYAIDQGLKLQDLLYLNEEMIADLFRPVIDVDVYKSAFLEKPAVAALVAQLDGFEDHYRRWKFDTRRETAWVDTDVEEEQVFMGGHESPGFQHLVKFLRLRMQEIKEAKKAGIATLPVLPDLAFVDYRVQPALPYNFMTEDSGSQNRIRITLEVLRALEHLADRSWSDQELLRTGLRPFFQQAGFDTQGELVLLPPLKTA